MKYFTGEGSYVWKMDSDKPRKDPELIIELENSDQELADALAEALTRTYIEGFEDGLWTPEGEG